MLEPGSALEANRQEEICGLMWLLLSGHSQRRLRLLEDETARLQRFLVTMMLHNTSSSLAVYVKAKVGEIERVAELAWAAT